MYGVRGCQNTAAGMIDMGASANSRAGRLCIDIGASKTAIAANSSGANLAQLTVFKTPKTPEAAILECARRVLSFSGKFSSVGIGICGSVDGGIIQIAPNMGAGEKFGAQDFARKVFKCRVCVENDVKCAALAEIKYGLANTGGKRGAQKSKNNLALLVWSGSGIGGAIVQNGKLLRGANNSAGEFGHMKIAFGKDARKCGCGSSGCFEAYCGGFGAEKAYFAKFGQRKSAKEIFVSNLPADIKFAKEAAHLFGIGLASVANALNPGLIILGGSLSKSYLGKYRQTVLSSFKSNAKPPAQNAKLVKSRLGHAVLLGASLAADV